MSLSEAFTIHVSLEDAHALRSLAGDEGMKPCAYLAKVAKDHVSDIKREAICKLKALGTSKELIERLEQE
jgi:hypothetical protein